MLFPLSESLWPLGHKWVGGGMWTTGAGRPVPIPAPTALCRGPLKARPVLSQEAVPVPTRPSSWGTLQAGAGKGLPALGPGLRDTAGTPPSSGGLAQAGGLSSVRLPAGAVKHRDKVGPRPCEGCGAGDAGDAGAEEEEKAEAAADEEDVLALVAGPLVESRRPQRVEAAFHCRVRRNTSIERRSLQELQLYHLPGKEGSFQRGPGLNLTSGQYTVPITGFYTFAATLYVAPSGDHQKKAPSRSRDRLRVLICIQSLCQRNMSLEAITGLEHSGELFTVTVHGVLYLQAGQYVSVFIDNATGSSLTIRGGSDFSAVFLGL